MKPASSLRRALGTASALSLFSVADEAHAGARIMQRVRPAERAASSSAPLPLASPTASVRSGAMAPMAPTRESDGGSAPTESAPADAEPWLRAIPAPDRTVELLPNDAEEQQPLEPGVDIKASTGVVHRSLRFHQDIYGRLRALDANLYVWRIDASVYPAFRPRELDGHVALVASYEGAFAGSVRDDDFGGEYPVAYSELFAGVRLRRLVQRQVLGFELGVGQLAAGLDDDARSAGTPDVRYRDVRGALDLGLRLGPVRCKVAAAFRLPLGYGELSEPEWFPRVGGYGVEAQADAAYPLSTRLALTASASLRRFVLEMNSEPEDGGAGISEVAGGAVDSFLALYAGLRLSL